MLAANAGASTFDAGHGGYGGGLSGSGRKHYLLTIMTIGSFSILSAANAGASTFNQGGFGGGFGGGQSGAGSFN